MTACYGGRSGGEMDGHPGPTGALHHRHHPDGHLRGAGVDGAGGESVVGARIVRCQRAYHRGSGTTGAITAGRR